MATYQENETMITAGIYENGKSPVIDEAIQKHEEIEAFLKQEEYEPSSMEETLKKLAEIAQIEIPEEEFCEQPALNNPSTAEIVDQAKLSQEENS